MVPSYLHLQCWMCLEILIPVGLHSMHRDYKALFGDWIKVKKVEDCLQQTTCFTPLVGQE